VSHSSSAIFVLPGGDDRALAYLKQLASQNIINFGAGNSRTLVDRVIAGEYPIALQVFAHHPLISAAKGAPGSVTTFAAGRKRGGNYRHSQAGAASLRRHAADGLSPVP
jgi:hypothetical protein